MLKEQKRSLTEYGKLKFIIENNLYNKLKSDCYYLQIYLPEENEMNSNLSKKKKSKGISSKEIDFVTLSFCRLKKQSFLAKIFSENSVLIFDFNISDYKSSEIREVVFDDWDNFRYSYNKLCEKDILSLNVNNKLFIVLGKEFFLYDIKTNKITKMNELYEDHSLGSLIFVQEKIFCLSGKITPSTEYIIYDRVSKNRKWEYYHPLSKSRAYFTTFIQNLSVIFVVFGYNFPENNYLWESLEKSDILMNSRWASVKLCFKNNISPYLVMAGSITETENNVLIIGGYNNCIKNKVIYRLNVEKFVLNDSFIIFNNVPSDDVILNLNKLEEIGDFIFKEETNFIALKISQEYKDTTFSLVCFDKRNNLHFFNVLTNNQFVFYFDQLFKENHTSEFYSSENCEAQYQIESGTDKKDKNWIINEDKRYSPSKMDSDKKDSVMQEMFELCSPEVQKESINNISDIQDVYEDETKNFNKPTFSGSFIK